MNNEEENKIVNTPMTRSIFTKETELGDVRNLLGDIKDPFVSNYECLAIAKKYLEYRKEQLENEQTKKLEAKAKRKSRSYRSISDEFIREISE